MDEKQILSDTFPPGVFDACVIRTAPVGADGRDNPQTSMNPARREHIDKVFTSCLAPLERPIKPDGMFMDIEQRGAGA